MAIDLESERLLDEAKQIMAHTEELLSQASGTVSEKAASVRTQLAAGVRRMQDRAEDLRYDAARGARRAAHTVDDFAHDNPWRVAGIAAIVTLAVALLITVGRRD
jgi:ElaB/YqjD/DUF883 family membrane-anchored ribosome-binding protein